jgi:hypothetical protein
VKPVNLVDAQFFTDEDFTVNEFEVCETADETTLVNEQAQIGTHSPRLLEL